MAENSKVALSLPTEVVGPRRGLVAAGLGLYALAPILGVTAIATGLFPLAFAILHCVLFGTMALSYGFRSLENAPSEASTLAINDTSITVGERRIPRSALKQGFLVPGPNGTILVRLERTGRFSPALHLRVRDEAEGRKVLDALGFDAAHVAAAMRVASQLMAMPVALQLGLLLPGIFGASLASVLAAMAFPGPLGGALVVAFMLLLLTWTFGLAFSPTAVRIGTDGIVTRWLGRERFVAYRDVDQVDVYDELIGSKRQQGVKLTLRGGDVVRLPTGQGTVGVSEAARLGKRIAEARVAGATHRAADATLVRRGESATDWVRALRRVGVGAGDLRTPAIPTDALLRVVEDTGTDVPTRVSAAIAAVSRDDPDARARVRIAADTSASPKLRVALERVDSAADEEELAAIVSDLDAEHR